MRLSSFLVFRYWFRCLIWRLGRKLYCLARQELCSVPKSNGEYWLIHFMLEKNSSDPAVLCDIGANEGNWASEALRYSEVLGKEVIIHGFEPSADSFAHLKELFRKPLVQLNNVALSSQAGVSSLFVRGTRCGINSLYGDGGGSPQDVYCETLNNYCSKHAIGAIDLVKSDAEGHDFEVLKGAAILLSAGQIKVWQFEYNHRWISARNYLRDVFFYSRKTVCYW